MQKWSVKGDSLLGPGEPGRLGGGGGGILETLSNAFWRQKLGRERYGRGEHSLGADGPGAQGSGNREERGIPGV